jgi:hypothetical protein
MESHEVLHNALENTSPKVVAAEMGVSLSLVYKWAQPSDDNGSGTANPIDRCYQLYKMTRDDGIVQWLCHKAGGFFVKNPKVSRANLDLVPATHAIVQRFAEMLTAISIASGDESISNAEAEMIRIEWDDLKRFTEGFVRSCENGDFAGMEDFMKDAARRK